MKYIALLTLLLSGSTFASGAHDYNITCTDATSTISIDFETPSVETVLSKDYDRQVSTSDALITFSFEGQKYKYKKNIYIFDDVAGSLSFQIFANSGDAAMSEVANLYLDDGASLGGFIKIPIYEIFSGEAYVESYKSIFLEYMTDCKSDW